MVGPAREGEAGLAIDPESGVFRRVAAGGHADLLTVERAWDPRRKRLRGEIVVEDTREIAAFFRLTAAEEGWRIVIVDGAEEMNRNAANAVLKILEEPPDRALLLLVSHNPGRLLPTIRSRCRRLVMAPLPLPLAAQLLRRYRPRLDEAEAVALAALSGGSVGRALGAGRCRRARALPLADRIAGRGAGDRSRSAARPHRPARPRRCRGRLSRRRRVVVAIVGATCGRSRGTPAGEIVAGEGAAMQRLAARADPAGWADLREEIVRSFAATRELNLDRKQTMLGAFFAIEETAR